MQDRDEAGQCFSPIEGTGHADFFITLLIAGSPNDPPDSVALCAGHIDYWSRLWLKTIQDEWALEQTAEAALKAAGVSLDPDEVL